MINLLTDHPSNDPDAPDDELPNPETMDIQALRDWDHRYMHQLTTPGATPLTAAQDQHWVRISQTLAFRRTWQRPY